jgi:hypothetical protein
MWISSVAKCPLKTKNRALLGVFGLVGLVVRKMRPIYN